jgi:putative addiction module component (TIGR02574 family)
MRSARAGKAAVALVGLQGPLLDPPPLRGRGRRHSHRFEGGLRRGGDVEYARHMKETVLAQVRNLPAHERLELIGVLWDSLNGSEIPVTTEERSILEARMNDIEANPADEESWAEAKAWLESRRR